MLILNPTTCFDNWVRVVVVAQCALVILSVVLSSLVLVDHRISIPFCSGWIQKYAAIPVRNVKTSFGSCVQSENTFRARVDKQ